MAVLGTWSICSANRKTKWMDYPLLFVEVPPQWPELTCNEKTKTVWRIEEKRENSHFETSAVNGAQSKWIWHSNTTAPLCMLWLFKISAWGLKKNSPLGFTSWQNHSEAQADLYRKLQRCQNASRQSNLNRSALYTSCLPVTTLVVDKIRDGFFSTWKVLVDTTTRECEVLFWMKRS